MITNNNYNYQFNKFSPDFIIVSSGYDSAIGDPKV